MKGKVVASMSGMELLDMWTWWAIWVGPVMGILAFLKAVVPSEYRHSVTRGIRSWVDSFVPYTFYWIPELDGSIVNELYDMTKVYLSAVKVQEADHVNLIQHKSSKSITFSIAGKQSLYDTFENTKLKWTHTEFYTGSGRKARPQQWGPQGLPDEKRAYRLQVHRADKRRILDSYLKHIVSTAKQTKRETRQLQIFTNSQGRSYMWDKFPFSHPSNFSTLALDPKLKSELIADLERFQASEEFYRRVGKAWKRGYLLYGPPGTGKSSTIAAIANKMNYDIYDLELTEVKSNSELRKLLLLTSHKSIIVIEDIDCSLDLSGQRKKKQEAAAPDEFSSSSTKQKKEESPVTLSGLLNFTDGLWSSCGSERIFIFTTNHIEQLDPALLRTGRMDMHIHLGCATFVAFKVMAENYLRVTDHPLFPELEIAMEGTLMTPSDVAEVLLRGKDDPDSALQSLIDALREHKLRHPPNSDSATIAPDAALSASATTAPDARPPSDSSPVAAAPVDGPAKAVESVKAEEGESPWKALEELIAF